MAVKERGLDGLAPHRTLGRPHHVLAFTLTLVIAGGVSWLLDQGSSARLLWAVATAFALAPLFVSVARDLRYGDTGVDLIALLAMAGALALGEYLAGAVVAVMLSGGQALEERADARARRDLTALLERAPSVVHRHRGGSLESISPDDVEVGDLLVVKPGEVVPVDGVLTSVAGVLDESALTGEAEPAERVEGDRVQSGVVNVGAPFEMQAVARVEESTYAGIIRLVEEATATKSPFVRLADRYALVFLPVTLTASALAWALSGSPTRALAVLVVATPCPLILAAPVAIISGVARAAGYGVIVKGGAALESLARADILLLDKTGTITTGSSEVDRVETGGAEPGVVLAAAASLDQVSPHVLAASIVRAARERGLQLSFPRDTFEEAGAGIRGSVAGREVAVGKASWVSEGTPLADWVLAARRRAAEEGATDVYVAIDRAIAGVVILRDPVRLDAARAVSAARSAGFRRVIMVTGDHPHVAHRVAHSVGVNEVLAELTPAGKVEAVRALKAEGRVVMVGDGINDAPALAAADVGIAMGARGATASSEAADAVISVDRLDRVVEAAIVAKRSRRIALQSVFAGMGLSFVGMGFAAFGYLPPVAGALTQEAIDVAVIANALRALRRGRSDPSALPLRAGRPYDGETVSLTLDPTRDHLPATEP